MQKPEVCQRLEKYAGKSMNDRLRPTNPCITAREAIEIADYIDFLERLCSEISHEVEGLRLEFCS